MMYISPKPLKKGSRVAIIAPASSFTPESIYEGIKTITKAGLEPVMGDNVFFLRDTGVYSAPLHERLEEFKWAIEDDSIDGIICAVGGFGSAQLLPYLPYDMIAEKRKPIMGFSDITAINTGILTRSKLITFNGPTAALHTEDENNRKQDVTALHHAVDLLMTNEFWGDRPFAYSKSLPRCVSAGKATGPAIGGNMSTFVHLIGTPFMPHIDDAILFMEDVNMNGGNTAMYFQQLALAGIFERVAGIVIGTYTQREDALDPSEPTIEHLITEYLHDGPPCIYGMNFSHNSLCAVIPIGTECILDSDKLHVMFNNPFEM